MTRPRSDLSPWFLKSSVMSTKITKCWGQQDFLSKPVKGLSGCKRWRPGQYMGNSINIRTTRHVWHEVGTVHWANNSSICIRFIYCFFIPEDRKDLLETFLLVSLSGICMSRNHLSYHLIDATKLPMDVVFSFLFFFFSGL